METVRMQVEGMSCAGCAERIDTVLRRVEGVHGVIADHVCGRVEVRVDPKLTDRHVLTRRIEAIGYAVAEEASSA